MACGEERAVVKPEPNRHVVVGNLVDKYGIDKVRDLVQSLMLDHPLSAIAVEFGVSQERVRQWKSSLGYSVSVYQVHPEVQEVLVGRGGKTPT